MISRSLGAAVLVIASACRPSVPATPPPEVSFDAMFAKARTVSLESRPGDSLVYASDALVTHKNLILVDRTRAEGNIFDRERGTLVRPIGDPGDAPGQFRRPQAVVALDSGRFVIFDQARRVLSFRDSLGNVLSEPTVARSLFNGLLALGTDRRLLLWGPVLGNDSEARGKDLHEFDYSGRRVTSYAKTPKPESEWAARMTAMFGVRVGQRVVTGALNSNRVRVYDPATNKERWFEVAAGWFPPIAWPSDRTLVRGATPQSAAEQLRKFVKTQRLMNGAFPLEGGRFVVRFQAFAANGDRQFYYAVADTAGRTFAVTPATPAHVIATRGDTAFWVAGEGTRAATFGSGVVPQALATAAPNAVASASRQ